GATPEQPTADWKYRHNAPFYGDWYEEASDVIESTVRVGLDEVSWGTVQTPRGDSAIEYPRMMLATTLFFNVGLGGYRGPSQWLQKK
ncbi:hypothetical protein BGX24_007533, partial [Mortierella sp. AD032]